MNIKTSFYSGLICLMMAITVGCSKDKEPSLDGDVGIAAGTFKGTLTVYPPNQQSRELYDATVVVTKDGDGAVKVTPQNNVAAAKSMTVTYQGAGDVIVVSGNGPAGLFAYNHSKKELSVVTERQSAAEITFSFAGTKQ